MARKRRQRRRSAPLVPIKQDTSITLSTLANDTVLKQDNNVNLTQDVRCISMSWIASYRNHTAGQGPLVMGLAREELGVSEIAEALDAAPTSQHDVPAIEHTKRFVRTKGYFDGLGTEEKFDEGRVQKMRINMLVPAGKALPVLWSRNRSGATLTTGTIIDIQQTWWVRWL